MEGDLNQAVIDREMKAMEAKLAKYNVDQLGEIPLEREWDNEDYGVPNGRLRRQRSQRDQNVNYGTSNSKVGCKFGGVYGAEFQLVQG
jgi:hypothetical protein